MYANDYKKRKETMMKLLTVLCEECKLNNTETMAALLDTFAFIISTRKSYDERTAMVKVVSEYLPVLTEEFVQTATKGTIN
jgi:hypothetical protein